MRSARPSSGWCPPRCEPTPMSWIEELRPIRLFSLYLMFYFFLATLWRCRQYHDVISLVFRMRQRWPKLTALVLSHRHIFLTWKTLLPLLLTLGVLLLNSGASWFVLPGA